ncbi:MAG: methyltransferase domain-containing protein [Ostreibacterium sp.]
MRWLERVVETLVISNETRMLIDSNSFDLVECSMTAHHMEKFELLIDEVHRVLKKGGAFLYVDLIDKTVTEKGMVFDSHHDYPEYHGVEFYRDVNQVTNTISNKLKVFLTTRIGPDYIFIGANNP